MRTTASLCRCTSNDIRAVTSQVGPLNAVVLLMLAGCATTAANYSPCGVDHVEASEHGLKLYFSSGDNEPVALGSTGLAVHRLGVDKSTIYVIKNGRLKELHKFQLLSSRYLVLNVGESAGTLHLFGGCSYDVKDDESGPYLDVSQEPREISQMRHTAVASTPSETSDAVSVRWRYNASQDLITCEFVEDLTT